MKHSPVRLCGLSIGLFLLLSWFPLHAEVTDDLESFRKKVAQEESKAPADALPRGPQLSMQIKQIENLIKRGNDEQAMVTLENLRIFELPPDLQEEWQRLGPLLSEELEKSKARRLEKWATSVDQLVKDTRKACLEAKTSDDLDALLLRCSNLQMQADRYRTVMTERLSRKLQGVAQTLTSWTSYLDYQNAGDGRKANEALRSLTTGNSQFPVLTIKDMESRFADVADGQMDIRRIAARVFDGINSPDDLPKALERLQSYSRSALAPQGNSLGTEVTHVTAYIDAWKAAQAGDLANATAALSRSFGGYEEAPQYYAPIKAQIEARLVQDKAKAWTKLTANPGEPARNYLLRIVDELKERGDYATMLDVMSFATQIDRTAAPLFSAADRQAIEQFLAGQRFEKVGDALAAVTSYRIVINLSGGKYVPVDQAQQALKDLQAKYPEAFKSYDGVLLEQMRALNQQLQILQNRPPGMPYPMGAPYRP